MQRLDCNPYSSRLKGDHHDLVGCHRELRRGPGNNRPAHRRSCCRSTGTPRFGTSDSGWMGYNQRGTPSARSRSTAHISHIIQGQPVARPFRDRPSSPGFGREMPSGPPHARTVGRTPEAPHAACFAPRNRGQADPPRIDELEMMRRSTGPSAVCQGRPIMDHANRRPPHPPRRAGSHRWDWPRPEVHVLVELVEDHQQQFFGLPGASNPPRRNAPYERITPTTQAASPRSCRL